MKFLSAFLGTGLLLALLYAAIARAADPRGEFGTGLLPVVELDARAEKMRLFRAQAATAAPAGLILGSSRAMKVNPRTLEASTGYRFFNFAVDNARAEDDLAIYRWAREQAPGLKLLVVGLDVEALHEDDRPEASLLRNDELYRTLGEGGLRAPGLLGPFRRHGVVRAAKRYKSLFTVESWTESMRAVSLAWRPESRPLPLMEFEADGYLRYRRWEEERAAGQFRFDRGLERCLTKSAARFEGMTALSAKRREYLRQLVDEAREDGARVLVWITSLHPLTVQYLERHTRYAALLDATRAYQEALARRDNVAVYDFSQPEAYQGLPVGWYDCLHIDEANAERVVAALGFEAP